MAVFIYFLEILFTVSVAETKTFDYLENTVYEYLKMKLLFYRPTNGVKHEERSNFFWQSKGGRMSQVLLSLLCYSAFWIYIDVLYQYSVVW